MPTRVLAIVVVALLAVGIGGFIVYDQVLRGDSAAALTLPPATASPAATTAPATTTAPRSSSAPATSAPPAVDGDVAGTWTVAAESVAGYRV
ncbi:MAG TPA: hypothetical protein VF119_10225, partial [Candidatus Limnocylindrales bacterium]